jgi:transaldolase
MKYFLDSAIVSEVRHALEMWDIDGVTTNPRHVQTSGKPFLRVIQEIGDIVAEADKHAAGKTVSVQTNPHNHGDHKAIIEEGRKLAKLCQNFIIKMPCTEAGFKACRVLYEDGIRANLTLCFAPTQALAAMRAKALYVSPFIGWKETNGEESRAFIEECVSMRDNYGYETEILVAAVRNGRQIVDAATAGAQIVTAAFSVYKEALEHPYTDMGLAKFQSFWDQTQYE